MISIKITSANVVVTRDDGKVVHLELSNEGVKTISKTALLVVRESEAIEITSLFTDPVPSDD